MRKNVKVVSGGMGDVLSMFKIPIFVHEFHFDKTSILNFVSKNQTKSNSRFFQDFDPI